MNNRIGVTNVIYIIFVCLLSACYFLPETRIRLGFVQLAIITAIFSCLYLRDSIKHIFGSLLWIALFCCLFYLVAKPFNLKYGLLHPFLLLWICLFPFFMAKNIIVRNNKWEQILVAGFAILCFLKVVLVTLEAMVENPTIMRAMTSGNVDEDYQRQMAVLGVGGYGVAYGCGMMATSLFACVINIKNKIIVQLSVLALGMLSMLIVFKAQFTTLLILTLLSIAIIAFYSTKKYLILRLIFLAGIITICVFGKDILDVVISIYQDYPVGQHLMDIRDSIFEEAEINSARSAYRATAIDIFTDSPIWGNDITGDYARIYTHSHSTFLSIAVATGSLGLFFYYKAYWESVKNILNIHGDQIRNRIYLPMIVFFVLLSFLNPTQIEDLSYMAGFLIPIIINILLKTSNHETLEK